MCVDVCVSVCMCATIRGYIEPIVYVCLLVGVSERDREGLSDLKRERIFQDAVSLACQSFQPCRKDNLAVCMIALYEWMCTYVCRCTNVNVPVMHKLW